MKNAAFTIIELLISVGIISIILGVSFAGYAKLNQRQTLISTGQNLKNIIRDAQSRVTSNEIDCTVCNCTVAGSTAFNGWTVDFGSQSIYGSCGAVPTVFLTKAFNLSSDIVISPYLTPASSKMVFKNNPPSVTNSGTVYVLHKNLGLDTCYVIRIKNTGTISDDGGLVSSCTP